MPLSSQHPYGHLVKLKELRGRSLQYARRHNISRSTKTLYVAVKTVYRVLPALPSLSALKSMQFRLKHGHQRTVAAVYPDVNGSTHTNSDVAAVATRIKQEQHPHTS